MGSAVYVSAHSGQQQRWTAGFILRLVLVSLSFMVLMFKAIETLVMAVRGSGYSYSFRNPTSSGYFSARSPSLGDAGWAFLLGPGAQLAVVAPISAVLWRRRRSWVPRLRAATWWLLVLDVLVVLILYVAAEAAVI